MFLWKFPRGYAKIEIRCERPERFLNAAIAEGLSLHNIARCSRDRALAVVRFRSLDRLSELASERGCELRVLSKGGASVLLGSLLSRPALIASVLVGTLLLVFLSTRVLRIEFEGTDPALERRALELLASEGVFIGSPMKRVEPERLRRLLSSMNEGVEFTRVSPNGVVLHLGTAQTAAEPPEDDERPAEILADRDCVILSIVATKGRAVVQAGSAVRKGELLVSADVTPEGGERTLTHAEASVVGEVAYRFTVRVEGEGWSRAPSGREQELVELSLFGLKLSSRVDFADRQIELFSERTLDSAILPIRIRRGTARELVLKKQPRDGAEMVDTAMQLAAEKLRTCVDRDAVVISKSTELIWNDDGSLTAAVSVHTIENIGITRYI